MSECENELNLNGIHYVHARAEEAGRSSAMRDTFDFAVARAVSSLPVLNEICLPLVKCNGMFLAMKGKDDPTEFMEGEIVAKKLVQSFRKKFHSDCLIPERSAICFSTKRQCLRQAIPQKHEENKNGKVKNSNFIVIAVLNFHPKQVVSRLRTQSNPGGKKVFRY